MSGEGVGNDEVWERVTARSTLSGRTDASYDAAAGVDGAGVGGARTSAAAAVPAAFRRLSHNWDGDEGGNGSRKTHSLQLG